MLEQQRTDALEMFSKLNPHSFKAPELEENCMEKKLEI